jgi:heme/copper-type cytochrome/quinol oxidase subunit 2
MSPPTSGFRRTQIFIGISAVALGAAAWLALANHQPLQAQEQAPERRDITITAKDFRFTPSRIEVSRDDLLRLTVKSEDVAYGFTIDEYRVAKRVPAGGSVVLELRADREGTFAFYSNMTNDSRHAQMRGELVVRKR